MSIIAYVTFTVEPSLRDEFILAAARVTEASQSEAGCTLYRFGAALDDPLTFHITEIWDSPEQLDAHRATAHAIAASEVIGRCARISSMRLWSGAIDAIPADRS